jgi:hypothetical protein
LRSPPQQRRVASRRSTPTFTGKDTLPEWIAFTGEGKCGTLPAASETNGKGSKQRPAAVRRLHDLSFPERETGEYGTIDELDMTFDYVQAKAGECVVWSKRCALPACRKWAV